MGLRVKVAAGVLLAFRVAGGLRSADTSPPAHPITSPSHPHLGQAELFGALYDDLPGISVSDSEDGQKMSSVPT